MYLIRDIISNQKPKEVSFTLDKEKIKKNKNKKCC